ncbi:LysR substrate-binding domain-containing protein [Caballeronia sp. LZ034LL]|uniref:LysR substrate-binding domain-containing protein n=1 Tax=Caballeronia sp. LZ034LL TaxID=3038567 RepID=UPI00285C2A2F|nr:LysR substrate-binding domain-containing protein [Caballeronia sp. LZ034LL]MDR5836324.1 LysR substrate-binding domain-containing protein [Caballeronia sp. LZ034LL]
MSQLDWYLSVNMKARHLRLLVAIYDFRNLRQVASNSYITVPAVSKALGEIESALGVKLFERTVNGLRPTAYGECVVRHARAVLSSLSQTAEEIKALQTGSAGKVHVGALPTLISTLMPRALARLKQEAPQTNVSILEGRMTGLLQDLRRGDLDMIVGRLPNRADTVGLHERALINTPIKLVTGVQHPLASRSTVQWSDLKDYPWILPPSGSLLREPIENTLARHGLPMPSNTIETLSTHLIRAYIQINDAIALHTVDMLYPDSGASPFHVLPLDMNLATRPLGVIWRADKPLAPSAMLLLQCLERECPPSDVKDEADLAGMAEPARSGQGA